MVRVNRGTHAQAELRAAKQYQRLFNTKTAAQYMKSRGWSLEAALHHLVRK